MIYFAVLLYLLFCVIVYDVYEKKRHFRFHYIVLFFLLTLIAGLRWRLGLDTVNYMHSFVYDIRPLSDLSFEYIMDSEYQPFWVLLNTFCKSFGDFTLVQILVSTFFHIAIFRFFYRCCKKPFTALSIFYIYNYFYFSMEIMRESLAIACFLYGVMSLNKGSLIKYYMWAICAFMFHFFAVFLFLLPPILKRKISLSKLMSITFIMFFLYMTFKMVLFSHAVNIFLPNIGEKIIYYILSEEEGTNNWSIRGITFNLFPLLVMFIFLYLRRKRNFGDLFNLKESIWIGCILLYSIFLLLSLDMPVLMRFSNYFYMIIVILYSSWFYTIRFKQKSQVLFILCCFFFMISIRLYMLTKPEPTIVLDGSRMHIHNYIKYYPYTSVFNPKEPLERKIRHSYWGDR